MKKDFKTISILVLIIFSIQSYDEDEKKDKKVNEPTKTTILDKKKLWKFMLNMM